MLVAGALGAAVGGLIGYFASKKKEAAEVPTTQGSEVEIESFYCAICSEFMDEPVMDAHGHCFCRSCIEEWLTRSSTCPMTNEPINARDLRRCIDLANAIQEYRSKTRNGREHPRG